MEAKMSSSPYEQLCRQFSVEEILLATKNFDEGLVIGEGGFGKVYKATLSVENGETFIVAIKRLDCNSSQGAPEFWAEIKMLTKLRHCNLVSLIGYCNDNSEMILIYDFMPHGTLDYHLNKNGTSLGWVQRLNIGIGAARGLQYLHTGSGTRDGVIHRDVKSTNILLDEDYAAKISDFGLAKVGPIDTSGAYVKTTVKGTIGYLDPEYYWTGRLTRKSDVYAFGVVLLELLCGRPAVDNSLDEDESNLANWASKSIKKGKVYSIIDHKIKNQISPKCLKEFVKIADRCIKHKPKRRPKMAEIVVALELSLTNQNKFDSHEKPARILSFARRINWRFNSPEVNSAAQSDRKPLTITEDTIEHSSLLKEDALNHLPAQTKSLGKENINHAYLSEEHTDDDLQVSSPGEIQILANDLKKFSFDDLKQATRDFRRDMRVGVGGFGEVFEGWMDTNTSSLSADDGLLRIAIKRFFRQRHLKEKFVDMTFLRKFNHPNIVEVLGYCYRDKKMFLVYEFVENGSLDSHLFTKDKAPLQWKTRVQIAKGVAEALLFLHTTQNQVDNFSIKIHQILLDKNFNAKISDFESARLVYGDSYKEKIIDPLYYYNRPDSSEFEGIILSFGLVLIQILTGERISKVRIEKLRLDMLNQKREEDRNERLRRELDPRLCNVDDTVIKEALNLALVALRCFDYPNNFTLVEALDILRNL